MRLQDTLGRWRIALTVERLASGLELNNANTLETSDPFTLLHISGEWEIQDNMTVYSGIDNILDKTYINTVTINPFGNNTASTYSPGPGISGYVGLKIHF